jgi:hypothetical protein
MKGWPRQSILPWRWGQVINGLLVRTQLAETLVNVAG